MAEQKDEALENRFTQLSHAVLLIGVPIIIVLLVQTVRRVRAIRALDAQVRAEALLHPPDPCADLAKLYTKEGR